MDAVNEWCGATKLSDTEEHAWSLYCRHTAGCMSARDFWHELSQPQQAHYLALARLLAYGKELAQRDYRSAKATWERQLDEHMAREPKPPIP